MTTRTATATGTITNRGNVAITFGVHLSFAGVIGPTTQVTLDAGETSAPINLSVTAGPFAGGTTVGAAVFLDRISPSPVNGIASTPVVTWTEPVVLDYSWSFGNPGVAAMRGPDIRFDFQAAESSSNPVVPIAVALLATLGLVLLAKRGSRRG